MKPLCTVGRNVKWCSPYGKQYRDSSEKLKIELSYDLAIPLLSMYSKESKVGSQSDICMPLFTAALFTIPKCLLMGEWINIMWYKNIYWRRQWHPTPVLLPGKSHGWRSLVGCRPWGCEESDTTEPLDFHFSFSRLGERNGNPLQCSCLKNPRDGGAWWAAVYGVAQSRTRLKRLSSSSSSQPYTLKRRF